LILIPLKLKNKTDKKAQGMEKSGIVATVENRRLLGRKFRGMV
jgi:hypothetical protein